MTLKHKSVIYTWLRWVLLLCVFVQSVVCGWSPVHPQEFSCSPSLTWVEPAASELSPAEHATIYSHRSLMYCTVSIAGLTSSVFLRSISSCCLFWASSSFSWCYRTEDTKLIIKIQLMLSTQSSVYSVPMVLMGGWMDREWMDWLNIITQYLLFILIATLDFYFTSTNSTKLYTLFCTSLYSNITTLTDCLMGHRVAGILSC